MADSIQTEEDLTRRFDPATSIVFSTFEIDEHYNLVLRTPEPMRDILAGLRAQLANFSELALVEPMQYHSTVLAFPLEKDVVLQQAEVPVLCRQALTLVGWVSLARFTSVATPELVEFVQSKVAQDFGTFAVKPSLHQSKSRQQLGPVIWQA